MYFAICSAAATTKDTLVKLVETTAARVKLPGWVSGANQTLKFERLWQIKAAGADKASALSLALSDAHPHHVPVAGAHGRLETVFYVDAEAAADVPAELIAASSP